MSFQKTLQEVDSILISFLIWFLVAIYSISLFLFMFVVLFPLSCLTDPERRLLQAAAAVWAKGILGLLSPFCRLHIRGARPDLRKTPYVVIANHQSLVDILVLLATLKFPIKFIAKKELFKIPLIGWYMSLARYIKLERGDKESGRQCLERAREMLRRGVSVVFFPEGTRSLTGEVGPFKIGAFKLAIEEKIPLLPLVISGTRNALPKKSLVLQEGSDLHLDLGVPYETSELASGAIEAVRDELREQIVRRLTQLRLRSSYQTP